MFELEVIEVGSPAIDAGQADTRSNRGLICNSDGVWAFKRAEMPASQKSGHAQKRDNLGRNSLT
jgi:hypothetical protein